MVVVGPIAGEASVVISVVVVATATVAEAALITSTSAEGIIGEGGVVLETATVTGVVSSRFVNSASLVAAVPGTAGRAKFGSSCWRICCPSSYHCCWAS